VSGAERIAEYGDAQAISFSPNMPIDDSYQRQGRLGSVHYVRATNRCASQTLQWVKRVIVN
jgi:hypothetical protein